jgi:hypothetical protein
MPPGWNPYPFPYQIPPGYSPPGYPYGGYPEDSYYPDPYSGGYPWAQQPLPAFQDVRAVGPLGRERPRNENTRLAPVFKSKVMQQIEELIVAMAPSEANVLLTGESGVGKEVIANVIHRRSRRAGGGRQFHRHAPVLSDL